MQKSKRMGIELIILCFIYAIFLAYCFIKLFDFNLSFFADDDYMRVIRLREFFQHHDLSNYIIARSNYPYGCDLHWTRLYDFFLIGLTWFIHLFVSSIKQSIDYACFIISPILGIISLIVINKIFRKILDRNNLFLSSVLFIVSPYMISVFSFGHPDHHAFITLCLLIYLYYTAQIVSDKTESPKYYLLTAIAATACVWASPETLIVLLLTDATLFLVYMKNYKKVENLLFKTLITACLVSTITMFPQHQGTTGHFLTLCLLMLMVQYVALNQSSIVTDSIFRSWHFVCLMMMLLFIPNIRPVEYDKISIVHTTLFLCLSVFFAVNLHFVNKREQVKNVILWSVVIGIIFLSLFPKFLMGMSADISPYVKQIWLSTITELQSPFKLDIGANFCIYSVITGIATVEKIREIKFQELTNQNIIWLIFIALASCYWILSCFACRMIPYSVLFSLPLVINLGMASELTKNLHRLIRIIITIFLSYGFLLLSTPFSDSNVPTKQDSTEVSLYKSEEIFSFLDTLSEKPITIVAHSNHGPQILYYTKHRILGASYHRQEQGIIYSYLIMQKTSDLNLVRKILVKTNAQYIFVENKLEKQYTNSFALALVNGKLPYWISKVELPSKFSKDFSLFKIDQNALLGTSKAEAK